MSDVRGQCALLTCALRLLVRQLGHASEVASLFDQLIDGREPKAVVRFPELDIRRILGVGTFGRVKLAVHTPTGNAYALKCMRKAQVVALTNHATYL